MDQTLKFLRNILKRNDVIVIACSGGPDSMFLTHILNEFKKELNLTLIIAHINHGLREQSNKEKNFVQTYCEANNLIFEYLKIENYEKGNIENQARIIRYDFFEKIVKKYKAAYLMTAHHGDDLMETILMRLNRGAHLKGYSGFQLINKKDNYQLVRPLIYMTKKEIENYLIQNNLKYYIDESNESNEYTRNRYRFNILPFLKQENKDVHLKYMQFSQELNAYDTYINSVVNKVIGKVYKNNILAIDILLKQDDFIVQKIISQIFHLLYKEELFKINKKHQLSLFKLIKSFKANTFINLPNNIIAVKEYNNIRFVKNENPPKKDYNYLLTDKVLLPNNWEILKVSNANKTDNYHIYLLSSEIKLPLIIRNRKPSDKIEVKNLNGTKKVKDIMIDEKILKSQRDIWPIVTDSNNEIIWIPGLKKSKFDKAKQGNYDIILKYQEKKEK